LDAKPDCMKYSLLPLFILFFSLTEIQAQTDKSNRATMYVSYGRTAANLRDFNLMLENKGLSPLRNGYNNFSFGYQTRFNDFIMGLELFQNTGQRSSFNDYDLSFRTTRMYLNVGFAFTEEGRFQLIHYMSVGSGFMNFQMLNQNPSTPLGEFLQQPRQGFILRDGNIHKGSLNFTGFLTEIGFQMSYDFDIPGREEAFEIITKFGYSFSPFEDSWKLNNISFGNAQSGAFIRIGAGISLPDHNFFYKDASIGAHFLYSHHFTQPTKLNEVLIQNGLRPFQGLPNNWGLKVLGESKGTLYGVDIYNLGMGGQASENQNHSLNSVRFYANGGLKLFERRNFEFGTLAGLGYANLRYTLSELNKQDFPRLFEEPDYDGFIRTRGLMAKPEAYLAYGIPLTKEKQFDLVLGIHAGYEVPLGAYRLGGLSMYSYMSNPYLQVSLGIRP
jgi:hypothetical protein